MNVTTGCGDHSSAREDALVANASPDYRIYRDLADWWPLISPPREYAAEAAYLTAVLESASGVHDVLDLGSGGGHVTAHLSDRFTMTLVDISPEMLTVSRRLNPGCVHIEGDMRTIRLGRTFDAVLVHDAVDYLTSVADLRQLIETAFVHCRPGGLALFVPDHVTDTFEEYSGGGGGGTDESGRYASFREHTWDPDPADDWVQADYEFVLREADGTTRVVRESHRLGAFSRDTWGDLLKEAGFEPEVDTQRSRHATTGRMPDHLFIGRRPATPA